MKEFQLKLNNTTYSCTSNHSHKDSQNWIVEAKINDVSISINIPIDSKLSRAKCMLFVEVFHESLMAATKEQADNLRFPTQLT